MSISGTNIAADGGVSRTVARRPTGRSVFRLLMVLLVVGSFAGSHARAAALSSAAAAAVAEPHAALDVVPATNPADAVAGRADDNELKPAGVVFSFAITAVALSLAAAVGVFRRGSILGPVRVRGDEPVWPIVVITIVGGVTWFGAQVAYGIFAAAAYQHEHPGQVFNIDKLAGTDLAFLATVPAAVAFAVLLLGDSIARVWRWEPAAAGSAGAATVPGWEQRRVRLLDRIGFTRVGIPGGVLKGLIAIVIVWPVVNLGAGVLLEMFYRLAGYEHPKAHELLSAMTSAEPWVRGVLVFGACVAAPVFEELLFRGHIQTMLVRLFNERPAAPLRPPGFPDGAAAMPPFQGNPAVVPPPIAPPPLPASFPDAPGTAPPAWTGASQIPPPPLAPFDPPPLAVLPVPVEYAGHTARPQRLVWLAVVVTSLIFASVHPLWMAPLIFVLSLCLGYAYERTGNLWVSIVIHALFNASSTLLFLRM